MSRAGLFEKNPIAYVLLENDVVEKGSLNLLRRICWRQKVKLRLRLGIAEPDESLDELMDSRESG
jgi:hypothetical protein